MRWSILILLVLALTFVLADDKSTTRSDFNIAGCTNGLAAGACSNDGRFYCGTDLQFYNTEDDAKGCSLGQDSYTSGDSQCCRETFVCNPDPSILKCEFAGCSGISDKVPCETAGCFWMENGADSFCVDSLKGYGCGIYKEPKACEADIYNLGQEGEGTEVCGTYITPPTKNISYVIPAETCECEWNDGCSLAYSIYSEIFGNIPDSFKCLKDYNSDNCVDGKMNVNWIATTTNRTGNFTSAVPLDVLTESKCIGGGLTKDCAKPLLKLPAFSLFALISSILIISAIYYFRKK